MTLLARLSRYLSRPSCLVVLTAQLAGCSGSEIEDGTPSLGGTGASGGQAGKGQATGGQSSAGQSSAGLGGGAGAPPAPPLCELNLTCPRAIDDDAKINCTLEVGDGRGAVTYRGTAGVELRGRSSLNFPKKNYSVELRDANGLDNPADLLGMGKEADWIFDGSWADRSFIRNRLVFDTYAELGPPHYAAESRFCRLELDGKPQGIYRLSERLKRDASRVAIAADDGAAKSFILKQDSEGRLRLRLGLEDKWELVYPKQETATAKQLEGAQSWLDGFASALRGSEPGDPTRGVFSYLDLDSTVDYVLIQEFSRNIDAFSLSMHLVRNAGGKASFMPWDVDLSFGQPSVAPSAEDPQGAENDVPNGFIVHRPDLIQIIAKIPAFKAKLGPRFRELRRGVLSEAALRAKIDAYLVTLEPSAVAENFRVFPISEVDYVDIYAPYSFYRVSSHAEEITHLWSFIRQRLTWLDAHIDAYPAAK